MRPIVAAAGRGTLFGAVFGWTIIHATAAFAADPAGGLSGVGRAYVSDFGLMVYHVVTGALLGGVAAAIGHHAAEQRMALQQEKQELEKQTLQAQKLETVGQLSSGIAHDFNNILSAIGMQLHLAANYPANRERNITKAQAAVRRAARLPQQLLAFSREGDPQTERIDPNSTLHAVVDLMDRTTGPNVELALDTGDVGAIDIDPVQFEQVIMNLVVNARDATEEGTITVSSARRDDPEGLPPGPYVQVAVTDTGSGIPDEALPTIFDPFFTTKEAGKGTGLGLATCKKIIEAADGRIKVQSRPGHTVFSILLPERPAVQQDQAEDDDMPGGEERIIVAEGDPDIRNGLVTMLEAVGYQVHEARHGVEALRLASEHKVDLVLADMGLSGISGSHLADRLQEEHPGLKVILTTDMERAEGSMPAGRRILRKPLRPRRVLQTVRRTLDG